MHLVERLREGLPEIYLLTDIICGFPSETEEERFRMVKVFS